MIRKSWLMTGVFVLTLTIFCKAGIAQEDAEESGTQTQKAAPTQENSGAEEAKKEKYLFGTVELPLNEYKPEHFTRMVSGREISIKDLLSASGIYLAVRQPLTKDDLALLEETYGLKKEGPDGQGPTWHVKLFSFARKDMTSEDIIGYLNHSYAHDEKWNEVIARAFPIFLFADGAKYLTGDIVIEWSPGVGKSYAEEMVKRLKLSPKFYDPATHVMIASPTDESGTNVFALSQVFGPQSGNAYVLSVEPQYANLDTPLAITARIEPADGKGNGGDIAGSLFRFVLEIAVSRNVSVSLNELRVTSEALGPKKWLPKSTEGDKKEVSDQVFSIEGPEEISISEASRDTSHTTLTYRFRMSQSGEFTLAPPPVLYSYFDPQLKKTTTEKVEGTAVLFRVSPTMPSDATMVNDATGMMTHLLKNPFPDGVSLFQISVYCWTFALVLVLGVLFWALVCRLRKHDAKEPSSKERARSAWNAAKLQLEELIKRDPGAFPAVFAERMRAIFGLYAAGDETYFSSETDIANAWPGTLGERTLTSLHKFCEVFKAIFDPQYAPGPEEAEALLEDFQRLIGMLGEEDS